LELENLLQIKWVVVLGGGQNFAPELPSNSMLENPSLSRLIEGIRIHRMLPGSKLVLSGGGVFDTRPEAATMADVAMMLGVDPAALVVEALSKDTQDQAYQLRKMLGQTPIILVTSASHMPRAMLVFENAGLRPTPAPVDFSDWRRSHHEPGDFFPRAKELKKVESALHEYLGILWVRLNWRLH
jgi:uncharacterized SAM-binding protein YcdF (DUF218 family)